MAHWRSQTAEDCDDKKALHKIYLLWLSNGMVWFHCRSRDGRTTLPDKSSIRSKHPFAASWARIRGRRGIRRPTAHFFRLENHLIIRFHDVQQEHLLGPANMWLDPREHLEISKEDVLQIASRKQ